MVNQSDPLSADDDFINIMRTTLNETILNLLIVDLQTNPEHHRYVYEVIVFGPDPDNDDPESVRFFTNAIDTYPWMDDDYVLIKYIKVCRNSSCFGIAFNNSNVIAIHSRQ